MTHNPIPDPNQQVTVGDVVFTHADIQTVVDDFYTRIQNDPAMSIPFQSVHDWPDHIKRLTHFWWIRFGGRPYLLSNYNPVAKHFFAGFNTELLSRWLNIFHQTLNDHLKDEQVELWGQISKVMGQSLTIKNDFYKQEYERAKS